MKEPTLEVIHSAAFNVTTNAYHQVFEKYGMWKVWEEGIQMAQQYLLTTHSRQQQLKGFRSEHLVGSPSCRLSGQWGILNKRNLCFPSCFFRPKCHSLWIRAAEWFSFWSWFSCIFRCIFSGVCWFWVSLTAAEWSFIFVLIFMCLLISRICRFGVTLRAAEWFLIWLWF